MTVETCQTYCASKNYPLAGVEFGNQCYCGLGLAPGYEFGQTGCSIPCGGDSSQICGGRSRLSVYSQTKFTYPSVVQSVAITNERQAIIQGCYVDGTTMATRLLNRHIWTSSTEMTVEACAARCNTRGFNVFGVEFGAECYCGTAVPSPSALAANPYECRVSFCSGDPTQFCGGGKRILIYA